MPGKSRRHRGKHSSQSKRRKDRLSPPVIATQQQAVAQAGESVSPKASVPSARTSIPAAVTAVRYPYFLTELRRIGILAGIMLAILIVLALVFA